MYNVYYMKMRKGSDSINTFSMNRNGTEDAQNTNTCFHSIVSFGFSKVYEKEVAHSNH